MTPQRPHLNNADFPRVTRRNRSASCEAALPPWLPPATEAKTSQPGPSRLSRAFFDVLRTVCAPFTALWSSIWALFHAAKPAQSLPAAEDAERAPTVRQRSSSAAAGGCIGPLPLNTAHTPQATLHAASHRLPPLPNQTAHELAMLQQCDDEPWAGPSSFVSPVANTESDELIIIGAPTRGDGSKSHVSGSLASASSSVSVSEVSVQRSREPALYRLQQWLKSSPTQTVKLVGAANMAEQLQQQIASMADQDSAIKPSVVWANALGLSIPTQLTMTQRMPGHGVTAQFAKDVARQRVYVVDHLGQHRANRVRLGAQTAAGAGIRLGHADVHTSAAHLLQICDGDARWRFQASQMLNQELPIMLAVLVAANPSLFIGADLVLNLSNSNKTYFEITRFDNEALSIKHVTIWRGDSRTSAKENLPFYRNRQCEDRWFTGELRQTISVTLLRPKSSNVPPRLGPVSLDITGKVKPLGVLSL